MPITILKETKESYVFECCEKESSANADGNLDSEAKWHSFVVYMKS